MSFFDIAEDQGEGDWGLGVGGDSGENTRAGGGGINITVTIGAGFIGIGLYVIYRSVRAVLSACERRRATQAGIEAQRLEVRAPIVEGGIPSAPPRADLEEANSRPPPGIVRQRRVIYGRRLDFEEEIFRV